MFTTIKDAFKQKDIRKKIFITLFLLFLFRLGSWIPVPGLKVSLFSEQVKNQDFLSLLSAISGGALTNGSLLALGVGPYISSSIIIQLLSIAFPRLQNLQKQGEEGKKKLAAYTKWCALILAVIQAIGITVAYGEYIDTAILGAGVPTWITSAFVVTVLVAGALFTFWLGEKITEQGIGNGLSLLIFVGILSTAATAFFNALFGENAVFTGNIDLIWQVILFIAVLIIIFALIVTMDSAERRVPVQYAKQIRGRRMMGGSNFIPIRLMGTGVMPIIFAMSLVSFPQLIMSMFWPNSPAYIWYATHMGTSSWLYFVVVSIFIVLFAYFYAKISFSPEDISKQIQSQGGYISSCRPGIETAKYLKKISDRVTLFGAIFLAFLTIVPTIIFGAINTTVIGTTGLVNAFSATGMIIIVSVALEIEKQLQAQMLMKSYKGFLK